MSKKSNTSSNPHTAKTPTSSVKNKDSIFISFYQSYTFHKLLLFSGAFLLYGWTYYFDYGIDDKFILTSINNTENNFKGIIFIFSSWFAGADYRPLSILSFWMERAGFGTSNPNISHAVNVFLFGLILIKIYDFIIASNFYTDKKMTIKLALLCGLIFLVHPNHVSVVANIKARDNLLSMLFGLFAAIQLIKYFDDKKLYRITTFFVFITCGFLSKLDSYIFIVTPVLILFLFRKVNKQKIIISLGITLFLFFLAFMVLGALKSIPNKDEYIFSMGFDENPIVGHDTFLNRLSLSLTSLFYYIKFLVVPTGYFFFFGYNKILLTGLFSFINIVTLILLVTLFYLSIKAFSKNKLYLFSLLFFLLSIAYALNLYTPIAGMIMDKYNFIASLGFCLGLSAFAIDINSNESTKSVKNSILIALFITLISFTVYRTRDWRNSFTLIEKDMPSLKQSANANRMAAGAYINLALSEELKPNNNRVYTDSLIITGERYAIQGLKIYDKVPDLWELRGLSSFYRKDYKQALQFFLKSRQVDSTYLSSINYVGYTYWALGNTDSACYYFKYVIDREPVFNYAANNMLNMFSRTNRKQSADSLITVFKKRFPEDKWLKQRIYEIYGTQ